MRKLRIGHVNKKFNAILSRIYDLRDSISSTRNKWDDPEVQELTDLYKKLPSIPSGEEILDWASERDICISELLTKMSEGEERRIMGNILQFELELYPESKVNNYSKIKRYRDVMKIVQEDYKEDIEDLRYYTEAIDLGDKIMNERLQELRNTDEEFLVYSYMMDRELLEEDI